jgi:MoaA/NifB/PqqE/SkfB family radical SAM enzyme
MYKVTSRWPHQSSIKIEWNLGKRCNYDCSYCPSSIHDNTSHHTDIEILKSTIDNLVELNKPIRLSFTGGEPCVHPKFDELISYARLKGISWISVTTNGTLPAEFYKKLPVEQFVFSLHFEYDWRKVLTSISQVFECNRYQMLIHVMAHHDHMNSVKSATQQLQDSNIPYAIRRVRWTEGDPDSFDDMRYQVNDLTWIKEHTATVKGNCIIDDEQIIHANDVIKLHLNQYNGWSCNAGLESLMINWDGDVHRATCRVGGSLGNIYENTFIPPSNTIICDRNYCTCAADIPLTKFAL